MNYFDSNEYFDQEKWYYSKSRDEYLLIVDMPFQQALFSHRKLLKEHGNIYRGSPLYKAFLHKLCPPAGEVRRQLERYGKACHVIGEPGLGASNSATVRSKFYHAASYGGKKVTTHRVDTAVGAYMEATVPVPMRRKVKK